MAFWQLPAALVVFMKALVARRLPHTVNKAEVQEFFSNTATRRQLADLALVLWDLTEPPTVICSMCLQHVGDTELAAVYTKVELTQDNPNPVKRFHANHRLAIIDHERANATEQEGGS